MRVAAKRMLSASAANPVPSARRCSVLARRCSVVRMLPRSCETTVRISSRPRVADCRSAIAAPSVISVTASTPMNPCNRARLSVIEAPTNGPWPCHVASIANAAVRNTPEIAPRGFEAQRHADPAWETAEYVRQRAVRPDDENAEHDLKAHQCCRLRDARRAPGPRRERAPYEQQRRHQQIAHDVAEPPDAADEAMHPEISRPRATAPPRRRAPTRSCSEEPRSRPAPPRRAADRAAAESGCAGAARPR